MSQSKIKAPQLKINPDALVKDQALLDSISLVTAIFAHAKRRPAVRAAFFAILRGTATLLMAEDKKFPTALQLMDKDAVEEGYGESVLVKKKTAKRKGALRGK
jgi:hypothetical protein